MTALLALMAAWTECKATEQKRYAAQPKPTPNGNGYKGLFIQNEPLPSSVLRVTPEI
jgi:hypothetical protein